MTNKERLESNRREVREIIRKAHAEGKTYQDISRMILKTGTTLRNYVALEGSVFDILLELKLPFEGFCSNSRITAYYTDTISVEEATEIVINYHKENGSLPKVKAKGISSKLSAALKVVSNHHGDYINALVALNLKPHVMSSKYIKANLSEILRLYCEGYSGHAIEDKLGIAASTVYSILRDYGIVANEPNAVSKRNGHRSSVVAGYKFEDVLAEILSELGYVFTKYYHDYLKPDFVLNDKWIDAKLTYKTGKGHCKTTYLEEAPLVEFIYLVGPKKSLKSKSGIIKSSVYVYIDRIKDKDKQSYFTTKLAEIKALREEELTEYSFPSNPKEDEIIGKVSAGMSMRLTAELLGIGVATVSAVCKKKGIKSTAKTGRNARKEILANG